jgi:hypothetical protein
VKFDQRWRKRLPLRGRRPRTPTKGCSAASTPWNPAPRLQRRLFPRPSGHTRTRPGDIICQEAASGTALHRRSNQTMPGSNNASGKSSGLGVGADGGRKERRQQPLCPALGGPEGELERIAGRPQPKAIGADWQQGRMAEPGERPTPRSGGTPESYCYYYSSFPLYKFQPLVYYRDYRN